MRTVVLTIQEFFNFKLLAKKFHFCYQCEVNSPNVNVSADSEILNNLGYE
jgi:hypothetical protein